MVATFLVAAFAGSQYDFGDESAVVPSLSSEEHETTNDIDKQLANTKEAPLNTFKTFIIQLFSSVVQMY